MRTWVVGSIRKARVGSIRFETQELHAYEQVQHSSAQRTLDAPETLRLFQFQAQAGHFQILGADTFQQSVIGHGKFSTVVGIRLDAMLDHPLRADGTCVEPTGGGPGAKQTHDGDGDYDARNGDPDGI